MKWNDLKEFERRLVLHIVNNLTIKMVALEEGKSKDYIAHRLSALYKKIGVENRGGMITWYHTQAFTEPKQATLAHPTLVENEPFMRTEISQPTSSQATKIIFPRVAYLWVGAWIVWGATKVLGQYDPSLWFALITGIYGLVKWQTVRNTLPKAVRWAFLAIVLAAFFWSIGELISWNLDENSAITPDISDFVGYIPHNVCLGLAAYFLAWSFPTSGQRGRQIALLTSVWLGSNVLLMVAFWYAELRHPTSLPSNLFDLYYPISDLGGLGGLVYFGLRGWRIPKLRIEPNAQLPYLFFLSGLLILLIADALYVITPNLPSNHLLAYGNGDGIDFAYTTAFSLQGLSLILWSGNQPV
ncbi:MAG: hypothetical protein U0350_21205 [Caldilineaceae bacterium]